jgi:general secretion pathway protein D
LGWLVGLAGLTQGQQSPPGVPQPLPVPALAQPTPQPAPAPEPAAKPGQSVEMIDFNNTPVTAVLEYYARLTGRSIIVAPSLPGVITFRSQTRLTLDEALQALDSVLAINGIGVVPLGEKFLKVVPIAAAKQEGLPFGVGPARQLPAGDTIVTHVLPLKYADAAEIVGALQPYLHAYGQLLPLTKSNSILITDTGANINQMMEIVKYVDQPSALRMETKVYELKHAKAADVAQRLQSIVQETLQIGAQAAMMGQPVPAQPMPTTSAVRPGLPRRSGTVGVVGEESVVEGKVILTPDERTNKLFVLSRPSNFAFFDRLIVELDAKIEPEVVMKVITLQYASAEDAASLLNALITGSSMVTTTRKTGNTGTMSSGARSTAPRVSATPGQSGGAAGGTGQSSGFLQYSEGVRVLPDSRTNSLLVMATKEDMERIEELVRNVDTAVAQVLVEVVIGEVKLDNSQQFSVNLFKTLFKQGEVSMAGGTATRTDKSGQGVPAPIDLTLGPPTYATAISSALTYYATFEKLGLNAVIQALASSSKFKVLSTPIIQTLHNQEASIIVGESRPVVTSTISSIVGTTTTNTSSGSLQANVDYKDIAIELKVTPRINPDGYVTMDIDQKINDIGGTVIAGGSELPVITKREAKSSVMVKDRNTIVLGGLIREDKNLTETKVPFVGDLPLIGHLFKSKTTGKTRTELIVFIRPTVLRSAADAAAEAKRRTTLLKMAEELQLEAHLGPAGTTTNGAPANGPTNINWRIGSPP